MDRDEVLRRVEAFLAARGEPLVAAWVFGSVARGTSRPDSDVDVAVLWDGPAPAGFPGSLALEGELERAVGRPTQVIVANDAPADLVHRVLRDGVLLLERDRGKRIAFEVAARNEYWDLLPFLERYRRARGGAA